MSDKVIKPSYFNTNSKCNSILASAKYQDNELMEGLNKIENLSKKINKEIENMDKTDNIVNIDFNNKKK